MSDIYVYISRYGFIKVDANSKISLTTAKNATRWTNEKTAKRWGRAIRAKYPDAIITPTKSIGL